jgi:hypothetical protein
MGFRDVKEKLLAALRNGNVKHDEKSYGKNKLADGDLKLEDAIAIINTCRGDDYKETKHHACQDLPLHVLKPKGKYDGWYIKFYFIEEDARFISFHDKP